MGNPVKGGLQCRPLPSRDLPEQPAIQRIEGPKRPAAPHIDKLTRISPCPSGRGLVRASPYFSLPLRGGVGEGVFGQRRVEPHSVLDPLSLRTIMAASPRPIRISLPPAGRGGGIPRGCVPGSATSSPGRVHDPARDVGVLINVMAGANPVVTVGDGHRDVGGQPSPQEENRREQLARRDLLEISGHMEIVRGENRQAAGAQQILGLPVHERRRAQPADGELGCLRRQEQAQIVFGCRLVMVVRLVFPVPSGTHVDRSVL